MDGARLTYVVVKAGETLAELAERYGMNADELSKLNGGARSIAEGDVIKVWQEQPTFEARQPRPRHVLGFYTEPMGELPGSADSFARNARLLSSVAPYWFDLDRRSLGKIKARVSPSKIRDLVADAHRRGVKILASIHNTDPVKGISGLDTVRSVLRNRNVFYNNLFALVNEYGFDGINLDIEKLRDDDRAQYTEFVRELARRAHERGKTLTVDVLGDARMEPYSMDFNYPALAGVADYLAIMTYDETKPSSPRPGPVASLPWVRETLLKALNEGVPREKILLGIPFYGYDWVVGKPGARAVSHEQVMRLHAQHGGTIRFHPTFKEPTLTYKDARGQDHEVWFENARSISLKLDLVRRYNLGGIILWRLGLEDPDAWGVIRSKLSPIE